MASQVEERLMAPGRFTVELDPSTPESVKLLSERAFCQIVVTGTRVDADAVTAADLISVARYRGVYRHRSLDRCRWEGAGLPILLGDEDGKANTYDATSSPAARPLYDGSNTSWIRNNVLRNGSGGANGITVGTITSAASPTKSGNIEVGDSPRDVLDWCCDQFTTSGSNPYEWKIDADGGLDVAPRQTLFPTTVTPTVLASRRTDGFGAAGSLDLIPVTGFGSDDDWEDWTSDVSVTGPTVTLFGSEYTFYGSDSIGSNPFVDLAGSALVMRRVVTTNKSNSDANNDAIATRIQGRYDDVERRPTLSTDMFDPGEVCRAGDSIYLVDVDASLFDTDVQVESGAGLVFPLVVRVQAMTWPIRDGMGVYCYSWNGSAFVMTDLSPYVVFDSGDARLDVGAARRPLQRFMPRWLPAA